ncbi:hypothetical protein P3S68_006481 [Capsicum galapagoense]
MVTNQTVHAPLLVEGSSSSTLPAFATGRISLYSTTDRRISSRQPPPVPPTLGGYKWKMIIYPNGNTRDNESGHISVYLAISGTSSLPAGWEVNAIFTFLMFNQLCGNYLSVLGTLLVC